MFDSDSDDRSDGASDYNPPIAPRPTTRAARNPRPPPPNIPDSSTVNTANSNNNASQGAVYAVSGGRLISHSARDPRFPPLYQVAAHPLVTNAALITNIYVFIQDTSRTAMEAKREFEKELQVPLGPDADVIGQGFIQIPDRSIIFARESSPEDKQDPLEDSIFAYIVNARHIVSASDIKEIEDIRDQILGPESEITPDAPTLGPDGKATGGTQFERTHIQNGYAGVNGSRCYTLTLSHQHPPNKIAPTSSIKVLNAELSPAQALHKRLVYAMTAVASKALKKCAPSAFVKALEEHAEWDNVPIVGYEGNSFTPALQANLAPAIAYANAAVAGLIQMGVFGQTDGHWDKGDSIASLTSMIVASRLPSTYEGGRFHLLSLGVFFALDYLSVMAFSGLNKHGGTPPIAPPDEALSPSAVRFITVCYPPESMLNGTSNTRINLASLGKGVLALTPEVTCNQLLEGPNVTNEATIAQDGNVFMEALQNLQFLGRGSLQISSHVIDQLPECFEAQIDAEKFLSAWSIIDKKTGERVSLGPWIGAPSFTTSATEPSHVMEQSSTTPSTSAPTVEPSHVTDTPSVPAEPSRQAALESFGSARKAHYLAFIDHCKRQAKFVPSMMDVDWDAYRLRVENGDFSRRAFPRGRLSAPSATKRKSSDEDNPNPAPVKKPKTADVQSSNAQAPSATTVVPTSEFLGASSGIGNIMDYFDDAAGRGLGPGLTDRELVESEDDDDSEAAPLPDVMAQINCELGILNDQDSTFSNESSGSRVTPNVQSDNNVSSSTDAALAVPTCMQDLLDSLSVEKLEATVADFSKALDAQKNLLQSGSLASLTESCRQTLSLITRSPLDWSSARSVSSIWPTLSTLEETSHAQGVDLRMMRALIMLSHWSMFVWVKNIVFQSINEPLSRAHTWVDKLVTDIKKAVLDPASSSTSLCPVYHFKADDYLPGLTNSGLVYTYQTLRERHRWMFNGQRHLEEAFKVSTLTIRLWLGFPKQNKHLARFTVLDIILSKEVPTAVLYLDSVWSAFQSPYRLINQSAHRAMYGITPEKRFQFFESLYQQHPIVDPSSKQRLILAQLHKLALELEDVVAQRAQLAGKIPSIPLDTSVDGDVDGNVPSASLSVASTSSLPTPPALDWTSSDGQKRFIEYLRLVYPLLSSLLPPPNASTLISTILEDVDFYLPFRQKAPTVRNAIDHISLLDGQRLRTRSGVFNLLLFRGVFYGSPFARSERFQFFDSFDAWDPFYQAIRLEMPSSAEDAALELKMKAPKGAAERYLCNMTAFKSAIALRSTQLVQHFWLNSPVFLRFLLQGRPTFEDAFKFLTAEIPTVRQTLFGRKLPAHRTPEATNVAALDALVTKSSFANHFKESSGSAFRGIGPLVALLICGDLVYAGVLDMPSAWEMGPIVASLGKGAVGGLQFLGLISVTAHKKPKAHKAEIQQAFSNLHGYLSQNLTAREQQEMGYDVLMLEHGLCKIGRVKSKLPWTS